MACDDVRCDCADKVKELQTKIDGLTRGYVDINLALTMLNTQRPINGQHALNMMSDAIEVIARAAKAGVMGPEKPKSKLVSV